MTYRMKLWCVAVAVLLLFVFAKQEAQGADNVNRETYFSADFNSGNMPEGVGLFDRDGQTQAVTSIQLGFPKTGSSWIVRRESADVRYAASSSRHKVASGVETVAADDWMVLPSILIKGVNASIVWKGRSVNEQSSSPSSYRVLLSTKGGTPEDFADAAELEDVAAESLNEWSSHYVSLNKWAGERVWIAFVNYSFQKELVGIDDIVVEGEKGVAEIIPYPGEYLNSDGNVEFGGKLIARTSTPVTSLKVKCETSGMVMRKEFADLNIQKGEEFDFRMDETITANYGDVVNYTLTVEVNGVAYDPMVHSTRLLAFVPKKKIVVEERTGTWCGYCPRGTVAMETLATNYNYQFIGIAIHVDEDPMALDSYANGVGFPEGAPTAWIDRAIYEKDMMVRYMTSSGFAYTTLNGALESKFIDRLEVMPQGEVTVEASYADGQMSITANSRFTMNEPDAAYRLALVVTEDHVWQPGYYQINYFAGVNEKIAGYENLPKRITENYEFNHVARVIYDAWNGIANSIPAFVSAGEVYTYTKTAALPTSVLNPANVHIVAMIIDSSTGEIVNADTVQLLQSGVEAVEADSAAPVAIEAAATSVKAVAADPSEVVVVTLYNLCGAIVAQASGVGEATVDTSALHGVYAVKSTTPNGTVTTKIAR